MINDPSYNPNEKNEDGRYKYEFSIAYEAGIYPHHPNEGLDEKRIISRVKANAAKRVASGAPVQEHALLDPMKFGRVDEDSGEVFYSPNKKKKTVYTLSKAATENLAQPKKEEPICLTFYKDKQAISSRQPKTEDHLKKFEETLEEAHRRAQRASGEFKKLSLGIGGKHY